MILRLAVAVLGAIIMTALVLLVAGILADPLGERALDRLGVPEPTIERRPVQAPAPKSNQPQGEAQPSPRIEVAPGNVVESSAPGDMQPIVKVAPQYPRIVVLRQLGCDVLVIHDVDTHGRTANLRIAEPGVCGEFHHSAIAAVLRYRYKPQIENGAPVVVHDVESVVEFRFEK